MPPVSIAVMLRLVGTVGTHADIIRLFFGQAGQLHAQIVQMQARHLFVEMLGQTVNAHFCLLYTSPSPRD